MLSIIIPVYNYERNIRKNVEIIERKIKSYFNKYEIIIVDDGSNDNTLNNLKKIVSKNIRILKNKKNIGKSYSISKALKVSKGEKIFFYDCDLPYFYKIDQFLNLLRKNDFVVIDRKNKNSKLIRNKNSFYQFLRHFIGNLVSIIINIFLNLNLLDTQAGMKGFKNLKELKKHNFISKRFFFDIELICYMKTKNIKLKKIPINYEINKESSIRFFDLKNFEIFFELIRVLIRYS